MSSPRPARARSLLAALATAFAVAAVVACASGTEAGDDDGVTPPVDARRVDARTPDARPIDGPITPPIDARPVDAGLPGLDGGIGGTCTSNTDCQTGECCFGGLMCIPGMATPLPPPFDCLPN